MPKKPKVGRPLKSPLPRENFVSFRLNEVELKALKDYSWRYDQGHGDVIRDALMVLSVIPEA